MSEDKPTPKKKGRKPILVPELVASALATHLGNVSAVARQFSVSRASVMELIGKRKALQSVLADAREGMLDNGESSLHRSVLAGEAWAVCFLLKTLGKSRGYIERSELSGPGGSPIPIDHSGSVTHEHRLDAAALRAFNEDVARAGLGDLSADGGQQPVDTQAADPPR